MPLDTQRTSTPGIYKRGTRYIVKVRDRTGRQFTKSAPTLGAARTLKASLTTDIARGEHKGEPAMTFEQYAKLWLQTFAGRTPDGIRPESMKWYRRVIEEHATPFFGRVPIDELRLLDVKAYAQHIASRGVSRNTVRLYVGPLRVLLATAVEDGVIRANPATGFRNTFGERSTRGDRARALSDEQLGALIAEIPEEYRLLVRFLAETGLRIGEAIELRWGDLDLERRSVRVERRYYRGTVDSPKSRNGVRTLPINHELATQLALEQVRTHGGPDDLVLQAPWGGRFDVHNFRRRIYKPAATRAGVPWANIHMLRHTCASRLFRAGWSAKHMQQFLGHHSPAFTLATYVHLMPDELDTLPLPPVPAGGAKVGSGSPCVVIPVCSRAAGRSAERLPEP